MTTAPLRVDCDDTNFVLTSVHVKCQIYRVAFGWLLALPDFTLYVPFHSAGQMKFGYLKCYLQIISELSR